MHEFAITQSMFDLVMKHAEEGGAKKVKEIHLVLGELTGVVEECVQLYLGFLGKGTIAEGVALSVKMVPAKVQCRNCGETFELKDFDRTCPHCGGNSLEIIAGKELFVESIEVE